MAYSGVTMSLWYCVYTRLQTNRSHESLADWPNLTNDCVAWAPLGHLIGHTLPVFSHQREYFSHADADVDDDGDDDDDDDDDIAIAVSVDTATATATATDRCCCMLHSCH